MKDMRQGVCSICGHNEIIQAAPVEWASGFATHVLSVTHETGRLGVNPTKPLGIMNIWVCRRCGFVQWFAFEPQKIPIGEEHSTRLVRGSEAEGPYR